MLLGTSRVCGLRRGSVGVLLRAGDSRLWLTGTSWGVTRTRRRGSSRAGLLRSDNALALSRQEAAMGGRLAQFSKAQGNAHFISCFLTEALCQGTPAHHAGEKGLQGTHPVQGAVAAAFRPSRWEE